MTLNSIGYVTAIRDYYLKPTKAEKGQFLDGFVEHQHLVTG